MKISIKQLGIRHLAIFGSIVGTLSVGSIWTSNQYHKTVREIQAEGRDTVEIHHRTEYAPTYWVQQGDDVEIVEPDSVSGDSVLVDDGWKKLVWPWHKN